MNGKVGRGSKVIAWIDNNIKPLLVTLMSLAMLAQCKAGDIFWL